MVSRIVTDVLLFAAGLVGGTVATVAHQSVWQVGTVPLPWGVILALLGVGCYLVGVRLVFDHRLSAVAAALGVLLSVGILSLQSAGGSVLIPANTVGQTWIIGCIVLAVIALAIPRHLHPEGLSAGPPATVDDPHAGAAVN